MKVHRDTSGGKQKCVLLIVEMNTICKSLWNDELTSCEALEMIVRETYAA